LACEPYVQLSGAEMTGRVPARASLLLALRPQIPARSKPQ